MSINIGPPSVEELRPRITVIGVGGAGGNAIANMIEAEIEGVDFIVANTDAQALNNSVAEHRIQLGPGIEGCVEKHYVGAVRHLMYGEGMAALKKSGLLEGRAGQGR